MLPKKNRLSRRDIQMIIRVGRTERAGGLVVKYELLEKGKIFFAGASVSKKVSKSAVKRNRIRRIIYREISLNLKNLAPARILVSVMNGVVEDQIATDLNKVLTKIGLKKIFD